MAAPQPLFSTDPPLELSRLSQAAIGRQGGEQVEEIAALWRRCYSRWSRLWQDGKEKGIKQHRAASGERRRRRRRSRRRRGRKKRHQRRGN